MLGLADILLRNQVTKKGLMRARDSESGMTSIPNSPLSRSASGTIHIDFGRVRAPERIYDADVSWIVRGNGFVSVFFAKQSVDEDGVLESRVELKYAPEAFVRHFWSNSREFHGDLKKHLTGWPDDPNLKVVDGRSLKFKGKSHSEWVNVDLIARSGSHGTIDFFYLPPFGLSQLAKGKSAFNQTLIVPVVRVMLTIHEMDRLLDAADVVAQEAKKYLPAELLGI